MVCLSGSSFGSPKVDDMLVDAAESVVRVSGQPIQPRPIRPAPAAVTGDDGGMVHQVKEFSTRGLPGLYSESYHDGWGLDTPITTKPLYGARIVSNGIWGLG